MKHLLLIAFTGFVCVSVSFAQNTGTAPSLSNTQDKQTQSSLQAPDAQTLPADFPVFTDTGNPEADRETYRKAKDAWISANPERYKALFSRGNQTEEQLRIKQQKDNAKP